MHDCALIQNDRIDGYRLKMYVPCSAVNKEKISGLNKFRTTYFYHPMLAFSTGSTKLSNGYYL